MPDMPYGAKPPLPNFSGSVTFSGGIFQLAGSAAKLPVIITYNTTVKLHNVKILLMNVDSLAPKASATKV